MKDVRDALLVAKASDGSLVRRPLSPHAGIYRWPITMVASILNRVTGIAISVGTLLLVWWLVAAASGPQSFALVQEFLISPLGLLLLFGWTAALFFHFWSGLRHLAWDMGYGFAHEKLSPVTWGVLALTVISTAAVWAVAYGKLGARKMAEKITVRRSQLGRVRGLGAAHEGVSHWWQERVSALALVPLTLWFVVSVLTMLGADQPAVAGWIANPVNAVLLLALIGMTFHHAALGLQVVYEDYIDSAGLRSAAILLTKGAALLLGLLAALAVLKLAMAGVKLPPAAH